MWALAIAIMAVSLSGCGAARKSTASGKAKYTLTQAKTPAKKKGSAAGSITISKDLPAETQALLAEADRWLGTAYRYGGNSTSGVDCSGLVCQVFANALAIKLPRNSAQQSDYCRGIDRKELIIGDLVFFNTGGRSRVSHVGIYVGSGNFIHTSSTRGVIVSSLSENYFQRTYHSSGRVERYYAMISRRRKGDDSPLRDLPTEPTAPGEDAGVIERNDLVAEADRTRTRGGLKALAEVRERARKSGGEVIVGAVGDAVGKATGSQVAATAAQVAARAALERTRRHISHAAIEEKVDSIVTGFFD